MGEAVENGGVKVGKREESGDKVEKFFMEGE